MKNCQLWAGNWLVIPRGCGTICKLLSKDSEAQRFLQTLRLRPFTPVHLFLGEVAA